MADVVGIGKYIYTEKVYIISLIGSYPVPRSSLLSLAALAPGLSEAELKTALYPATIAEPTANSTQTSSRKFAEATRLARANVQRALDTLTRRSLIATRQSDGRKASTYLLNFTTTTSISTGLAARPLTQTTLQFQDPEWSRIDATGRPRFKRIPVIRLG